MARNTIVVSLRARGINTFQYQHLFDFTQHLSNLFKQFVDIGCSGLVFLQLQSWSNWISVLLTFLACIFYNYYDHGRTQITGSYWSLLCFVVILPLLGALFQTFKRREEALRQFSKVKALVVAFYCTFQDSLPPGHAQHGHEMRANLQQMLEDLRTYCQHTRRYARHYTNPLQSNDPVPTKILYDMSKTLGVHLSIMQQHMRNLHRSCQQLEQLGGSSTGVLHARSCVLKLHSTYEQLASIKEFRLPQMLRSMLRFYVLIVLPVFGSPYWVWLAEEVGRFGLAVILGLLIQLVLCGLLSCATDLEDPFNEAALDGISSLEMTEHCSMMLEDYYHGSTSPAPPPDAPPPSGPRPRQKTAASNSPHPPTLATSPAAVPVNPRFPRSAPTDIAASKLQMPPMPPMAGPGFPTGSAESAV